MMPSFELSKLQAVSSVRPLGETDDRSLEARLSRQNPQAAPTGAAPGGGVRIEVNAGVDASTPPVDDDRVAQIRDALRTGNYPLTPTKIADAMIAAQLRPIYGE